MPRQPLVGSAPSTRSCDCEGKLAAIAARLDALQNVPSSTPASSSPSSFASVARAGAGLAIAALGLSGPMGWGVLGAATIGAWLIGRRVKRRKSQRANRNSQLTTNHEPPTTSEATAAADVSFPIERDDREARELLRLSQLEGRDPLQDALAGRLALDRLDAIAEGDADANHATWADRLRRELREKFNEIAPTKFHVPS